MVLNSLKSLSIYTRYKYLDTFGVDSESVVDGDNIHYAIFCQGCPHHCPNCHNKNSQKFYRNQYISIDIFINEIKELKNFLGGVTLSGGEPFCQVNTFSKFAKKIHTILINKNIWCYSGYTFEEILADRFYKRRLLLNIDILVDGPFILSLFNYNLRFKGSSNQRIIDIKKTFREGKIILYIE